jgi:hypothetical protein
MLAAGVEALTNVLQVAVNVLFHDVRPDGYLPGGQRLVEDELADGAAERIFGRARNGWLAWALVHDLFPDKQTRSM